jgi:zinc protease
VQHEYAHHIMKAFTWELENFIRTGLTQAECDLAKNKARVLYLSLAETTERLLGYRLDDEFYGLETGYLGDYLERIDAVTCEQVNAAIRKYLQAQNLHYVVVTDAAVAPQLAKELAGSAAAWGKGPADYQIAVDNSSDEPIYQVPEPKLELLQRDAAWAHYWLDIPADKIRIISAAELFK